jgi:iron complex outermembrane receptor protein
MSPHTSLAILISALLSSGASLADTTKALDRITVSASTSRLPESDAALPNTITIINREQLDQQLSITQDLSQILANLIPSFTPSRQKLTNAGETLRGRKPLYLVDGVPQSTPLREGGRDGHTIDPAMIERIEVIHGANALQGLGASGGIINIITKRAPSQNGSYDDLNLATSLALPKQSDSLGYKASWVHGQRHGTFDWVAGLSIASEGLFYDADGQAIAVNDVQGDLMDARSGNPFLKLGWELSEGRRLQISANHFELQGNNDYRTVNGNISTGQLATSPQPAAAKAKVHATGRRRSTVDYSDDDLAGGYLQAQLLLGRFRGALRRQLLGRLLGRWTRSELVRPVAECVREAGQQAQLVARRPVRVESAHDVRP